MNPYFLRNLFIDKKMRRSKKLKNVEYANSKSNVINGWFFTPSGP